MQRERARSALIEATETQLALLGPAAADPDAVTGLVDDDPLFDDCEEAQTEWEQTEAAWIASGFPGCDPACPMAQDEPRMADEGFVVVEPDEVKTKAQPSTGRKEVWTFTAVVLVAGLRYAFAEVTVEGLWLQVSAMLLELGVLNGERRLLVLGDGATWIPNLVRGTGDLPKSDDLVLVAPSETMLRTDEFRGGSERSSPRVREGTAGAVVGRKGECGDRTSQGGLGVA